MHKLMARLYSTKVITYSRSYATFSKNVCLPEQSNQLCVPAPVPHKVLRVLLLNYHPGDEMYESIRNAYPNAKVTTVGEESGPDTSTGDVTHL